MWGPHESQNDDDSETEDQWAKVNESCGELGFKVGPFFFVGLKTIYFQLRFQDGDFVRLTNLGVETNCGVNQKKRDQL
jgi:hypothetical protein